MIFPPDWDPAIVEFEAGGKTYRGIPLHETVARAALIDAARSDPRDETILGRLAGSRLSVSRKLLGAALRLIARLWLTRKTV